MPTEWSPDLFGLARVAGRPVVASFDGGAIASDTGALLLGATDRATGWSIGSRPASAMRVRWS
ncbi:MAG: family transposase [Rhodospirillales bacterium]|nr:family transposase [Rhodospirillales bacterium]